MSDAIAVVAMFTPLAGKADELLEELAAVRDRTVLEDGCIRYALLRNDEKIVLIEHWRDREAFDVHSAGQNIVDFRAALQGRVDGQTQVQRLTPVPGEADAARI